jgi:hypothetical protein
MGEGGTQEPSSDPFEEAYVAYLKAVQRAWADVDVDAVVSEARRHGHLQTFGSTDCIGVWPGLAHLSIMPMGCWSCLGESPGSCIGTYGTHGTYGTYGSRASSGPAESTER